MKQMSRMQRKMSLTFFGKSSACCSAASQIFGCLAVQLDQTRAEVDDLILDCVSMEVWWLNQVSIDGKNCWVFLPGRHHNTTTILREGSSFRLPFRLWTKHLPISVNFCLASQYFTTWLHKPCSVLLYNWICCYLGEMTKAANQF